MGNSKTICQAARPLWGLMGATDDLFGLLIEPDSMASYTKKKGQ
jgi:hypothetical protein